MNLKNTFGDQDFVTEQIDGIPVIRVNILRATLKEVKSFKQIFDSLITANHHKIIVDFSECHFADSAIVGVIITVAKQLRNDNGDIRAVTPPGSIDNIFAVTGLSKIIIRYKTLEEALASFS